MSTPQTHPHLPFNLSERDLAILEQTDEEFTPCTLNELKDAVDRGDISSIPRFPSILRRYIGWTESIRKSYGSVTEFVLQKKLAWKPLAKSESGAYIFEHAGPQPLKEATDYKILRNDWPYGVRSNIVHLLLWSKIRFDYDADGTLTAGSTRLIENFIDKIFRTHLQSAADLLWFKNPVHWQTVAALEHIHVIIQDADEEWIELLTGQQKMDIEALKQ